MSTKNTNAKASATSNEVTSAPVNNNAKQRKKKAKVATPKTEQEIAKKNRVKISSECNALYVAEFKSLKSCLDVLLNSPHFEAKRANLTTLGINLADLTPSNFVNFVPSDLVFTWLNDKKEEQKSILKKAFPKDYTKAVKIATLAEYRRNTWTVRAVCQMLDKYLG
jgi:hypothetical protein